MDTEGTTATEEEKEEVELTPPPTPEPPKTEINLGPVEGTEIHFAHMEIQLTMKELEKVEMKLRISQQGQKMAEVEKQDQLKTLREQEKTLAEKMTAHGIPEGWSFVRNADGTYVYRMPLPPPQPKPPMR